jgi:opacity protein-like surface antigen
MSKRIALVAALSAAGMLTGVAVADAHPFVSPKDNDGCNFDICIIVNGSGNHITHVEVLANDDVRKMGQFYLDIKTPGGTARNYGAKSPGYAAGFIPYPGIDYDPGTQFCGGAFEIDGSNAPGYPCITVPV